MGDANSDWLAYGLEYAYSDNSDVGIVRKHRTDSGLISYDARRDTDWPQAAREIIAAEKPKVILMMIGNNDRQTIREKVPPVPSPSGAPKANAPPAPSAAVPGPPMRPDLEQHPREAVERNPHMTPEQVRQATYGPWEFRSEKWELAYIKRIDATIASLKSAGVPVIWVGLASQRNTKSSEDSSSTPTFGTASSTRRGAIRRKVRITKARSAVCAPAMASISPSSARASLRIMWSGKSSASSATRAFRSRCRFRSIRARRPQKPSRVPLP